MIPRQLLIVFLGSMLGVGCAGPAREHRSGMSARDAADQVERTLASVRNAALEPGPVESRRALARLEEATPWLAESDETLRRRARLVSLDLRDATVDRETRRALETGVAEVREAFRERRYRVDERRLSLSALQRLAVDDPIEETGRELWWLMTEGWADLAPRYRLLFDLRNSVAKMAGYPGGDLERVRAREEIDSSSVDALLRSLADATDEVLIRSEAGRRPWSLPEEEPASFSELGRLIEHDDAIAAVSRLLIGMGFAEDQVGALIDEERERIGEKFEESGSLGGLLFRLGRELYHANLPTEPRELSRVASRALEAAIARFFAQFASDEGWLRSEFPDAMSGIETDVPGRSAYVIELRALAARVEFEREACRNPGRDLDELWWDLLEKWVSVKRFGGVSAWVRDRGLAVEPFRGRDELLARLIAAQIRNYLLVAHGHILDEPRTAEMLRARIFSLGASRPWNETLRDATAEPLRAEYYLRDLLEGATREEIEAWLERQDRLERSRFERPDRLEKSGSEGPDRLDKTRSERRRGDS